MLNSGLLFVLSLLITPLVFATGFQFSGQLLNPDGTPVTGTQTVDFDIQNGDCILYSETQTILFSPTGRWTALVGSAPGAAKRNTAKDTANTWPQVFQTSANVGGRHSMSGATCTVTAGTPGRSLVLTVGGQRFSPGVALTAAPTATVAETLQGIDASGFLRTDATANLTQTNLTNFFAGTNFTRLSQLLANDPSTYVRNDGSTALPLPTFSSAPNSPSVGAIWYDSVTNQLKYQDSSSTQVIGAAGSGISSLNGLTGSAQTFTVSNGGVTPAFSSTGSVHTLNLPLASSAGVTAGLISKADYDNFNSKMTNSLPTGQVWVGDGGSVASARTLKITDVKSNLVGNWFAAPGACAAGEVLSYNSATDSLSCQPMQLSATQISSVLNTYSGNLGIGTSSATSKLHLANSGAAQTYLRASNSITSLNFGLDQFGVGFLSFDQMTSGDAKDLNVWAQSSAGGNGKGGSINLYPGAGNGSGAKGVLNVGGTSDALNLLSVNASSSGVARVQTHRSGSATFSMILNGSGLPVEGVPPSTAALQTGNPVSMAFVVHNNERMRIDHVSGNVGIGTLAPSAPLTVGANWTDSNVVAHFNGGIKAVNSASGTVFPIIAHNSFNTNLAGAAVGFITGPNINPRAALVGFAQDVVSNHGGLKIQTQQSNTLQTRMTILSSGNVGIGTDSPDNLLSVMEPMSGPGEITVGTAQSLAANQVIGRITFRGRDGAGVLLNGASIQAMTEAAPVANSIPTKLVFKTGTSSGGTERVVIDSLGRVGIGVLSPNEFFQVSNGTTTGSFTNSGFTHSSDLRFKHDIKPLEQSLQKIVQLQGTHYIFNNDPENKLQIGLIAQEVEKVFPEVVHTDKKGFKSLVYGNLVAPIIEAIKELNQRITNLENSTDAAQTSSVEAHLLRQNLKIQQLEAENIKLQNEIKEIKAVLGVR